MLGRVRTGQNHSLWSVNRAVFQTIICERLLSLSAATAGFCSLPDLSRGYSVLGGKTGEVAELLSTWQEEFEAKSRTSHTIVHKHCFFVLFIGFQWLKVFFMKSNCIFLSQKNHLGANFNLAQGKMNQVGIRHLQQPIQSGAKFGRLLGGHCKGISYICSLSLLSSPRSELLFSFPELWFSKNETGKILAGGVRNINNALFLRVLKPQKCSFKKGKSPYI